jgi:hypothetical protein
MRERYEKLRIIICVVKSILNASLITIRYISEWLQATKALNAEIK